ncbi:hypothetical protein AC1031_005149 [Aphanomyces cochlioides]|nr:hypothetical protein AC1031_005149 [Aphanomyces cochlioides]
MTPLAYVTDVEEIHARLERLFGVLPKAAKLILVYGIFVGDKDLIVAPAMTPFRPTKNMEEYIAAAIASNNLPGAIDCLAYLPLSAADFFHGIGHAAACGKMEIAQYLAAQLERAHHASILHPARPAQGSSRRNLSLQPV